MRLHHTFIPNRTPSHRKSCNGSGQDASETDPSLTAAWGWYVHCEGRRILSTLHWVSEGIRKVQDRPGHLESVNVPSENPSRRTQEPGMNSVEYPAARSSCCRVVLARTFGGSPHRLGFDSMSNTMNVRLSLSRDSHYAP
jgi:hypothetical protein